MSRTPPASPAHKAEMKTLVDEAIRKVTLSRKGRPHALVRHESNFLAARAIDVLAIRFSQDPTVVTAFLEGRAKEIADGLTPEPASPTVEPEPEGPGQGPAKPAPTYGGNEGEIGGPQGEVVGPFSRQSSSGVAQDQAPVVAPDEDEAAPSDNDED